MKTKIILILAVFILLPTGVFAAESEVSAGILPNNPFYFLDKWGEWIKLNIFTQGDENKVKLTLRYIEEKQKEIEVIAEKGKKVEKAGKALKEEIKYAEKAAKYIESLKNKGKDVGELISKLEQNLARHTENLERVYNQVPDEAREAIRKVIENSKSGLEKAMEVIQKEEGEESGNNEGSGTSGILEVGKKVKNNINQVQNQFQQGNEEARNLTQ